MQDGPEPGENAFVRVRCEAEGNDADSEERALVAEGLLEANASLAVTFWTHSWGT